MDGVESIRAGQSMGGKRPEDMSPQELHATLWQILKFRDSGRQFFFFRLLAVVTHRISDLVMKKIEKTVRIPRDHI
jgi:hypothetical protein